MPSEQPREGTQVERCVTCGSPVEVVTSDEGTSCYRPAQPQPMGEGDDLAARLDERAELWERKGGLGANIAAGAYREAAQLARASTHPEQSGRVDPEQLRLVRNMAKIEASQSDPEQAPAFTDERRASHRRRADALNAVLAALEPASPTPTEQENDR